MGAGNKPEKPIIYRVVIDGYLDRCWTEWFPGMSINHENDKTILEGQVIDQCALQGMLQKICSLNLGIISVDRVEQSTGRA